MPKDFLDYYILRFGKSVLLGEKSFSRAWRIRWEDPDRSLLSMSEPIRPEVIHWIIGPDAKLIRLQECQRKPSTPKFLKRIVNFTRIYYRTDQPCSIRLDELQHLLKGTTGSLKNAIYNVYQTQGADAFLTPELLSEVIGQEITYEEA